MQKETPELVYNRALVKFRGQRGFDEGVFSKVAQDTSDETVVLIMQQFTLSLAKAAHELHMMDQNIDATLISKICHKLRGSSELLGFKGFSLELQENSAFFKNSDTSEEKLTAVEQLVAAIAELQSVLESVVPPK